MPIDPRNEAVDSDDEFEEGQVVDVKFVVAKKLSPLQKSKNQYDSLKNQIEAILARINKLRVKDKTIVLTKEKLNQLFDALKKPSGQSEASYKQDNAKLEHLLEQYDAFEDFLKALEQQRKMMKKVYKLSKMEEDHPKDKKDKAVFEQNYQLMWGVFNKAHDARFYNTTWAKEPHLLAAFKAAKEACERNTNDLGIYYRACEFFILKSQKAHKQEQSEQDSFENEALPDFIKEADRIIAELTKYGLDVPTLEKIEKLKARAQGDLLNEEVHEAAAVKWEAPSSVSEVLKLGKKLGAFVYKEASEAINQSQNKPKIEENIWGKRINALESLYEKLEPCLEEGRKEIFNELKQKITGLLTAHQATLELIKETPKEDPGFPELIAKSEKEQKDLLDLWLKQNQIERELKQKHELQGNKLDFMGPEGKQSFLKNMLNNEALSKEERLTVLKIMQSYMTATELFELFRSDDVMCEISSASFDKTLIGFFSTQEFITELDEKNKKFFNDKYEVTDSKLILNSILLEQKIKPEIIKEVLNNEKYEKQRKLLLTLLEQKKTKSFIKNVFFMEGWYEAVIYLKPKLHMYATEAHFNIPGVVETINILGQNEVPFTDKFMHDLMKKEFKSKRQFLIKLGQQNLEKPDIDFDFRVIKIMEMDEQQFTSLNRLLIVVDELIEESKDNKNLHQGLLKFRNDAVDVFVSKDIPKKDKGKALSDLILTQKDSSPNKSIWSRLLEMVTSLFTPRRPTHGRFYSEITQQLVEKLEANAPQVEDQQEEEPPPLPQP